MGKYFSASFLACALAWQAGSLPGQAQIITLANNNSVAQVNTGSSSGMFSWQVQGQQELAQQWFWFRVGSSGGESPINTISSATNTLNNGTRGLSTVYANAQFSIQVDYLLTGGVSVASGTNQSDIAETITITKAPTVTSLDFHFFQYSDFDINGANNNTIQLGRNLDGLFNEARQTGPNGGLSETVTSPGANHGEAGAFPGTLNELNDLSPTTLSDNAGPVTSDVTWALEWDFTLNASNPSEIISKDKRLLIITPEPSTWAVISVGAVLFALFRRRRLANQAIPR